MEVLNRYTIIIKSYAVNSAYLRNMFVFYNLFVLCLVKYLFTVSAEKPLQLIHCLSELS